MTKTLAVKRAMSNLYCFVSLPRGALQLCLTLLLRSVALHWLEPDLTTTKALPKVTDKNKFGI
jgi:hypothetical protein